MKDFIFSTKKSYSGNKRESFFLALEKTLPGREEESWKLSIFQFLIHEKSIPKSGTIWRHNKTMNKFYCGKEARGERRGNKRQNCLKMQKLTFSICTNRQIDTHKLEKPLKMEICLPARREWIFQLIEWVWWKFAVLFPLHRKSGRRNSLWGWIIKLWLMKFEWERARQQRHKHPWLFVCLSEIDEAGGGGFNNNSF